MEYTTRDFFHAVLPEAGYVILGRLAPEKGSPFLHDVYDTIDAALLGLAHADYAKQNYYFAIATYAEPSVVERGKKRVRTQSNAKFIRSVILDIDVKTQDGYYTNKDEAFAGIQRITASLNMPEPLVVDSGFGYHVYWPMAAGVPSKEWQATAKLFYQALSIVEPRAVADASRVSDTASVLRIPDSLNLKYGQQTPVSVAQWHSDLLDFGEFRTMLARITGKSSDTARVTLEVAPQTYERAQLQGTLKNCNWAGRYIKNVATMPEPAWYGMLGLASFVEHTTPDGKIISGEAIAHLFSKGHPDYSPEATLRKFEQVRNGQTGPTTCAKFQQIDGGPCSTCPFAGAVKSPLQTSHLSRPVHIPQEVITTVTDDGGNKSQEQVVIPVPPKPYFRGENGGVYVRIKEKVKTADESEQWEEKIVKIYDYDLYPVKRFRSELVEEEQLEIHLWLPKDGIRRFKMPTELLVEQKRLSTFLASRGAIGEQGGGIRLSKYMIDYARHMQTQDSAEVEYSRFGWRDIESDNPKFIVGNGYVDKEGVCHPAAFPSYLRNASTAVAAHGNLEKWKEGFNVYKKIPNSEAFIFTAMIGFAAPGMALTPYAGVLYNMVGSAGAGKSASLRMMTSVWGKPHEQRISINDTQIATYNTIGYLNSVPVAFDEATNMDPTVASQFALNFTGGRGKDRAGRDGQNKDNHITWDTIVVCSSNTSMYSKFTAARRGYSAEHMRLFEVSVPAADLSYKSMMDEALAAVNANYGVAGRAFIGMVMRNRGAIAKAIEVKANKVLQATNGSTAERFWATLVACVHVMGTIAKQQGLHSYDMDSITTWAMEQMGMVRENSTKAAADPKGLLGEFINKSLSDMVRVRDGKIDLKTNINEPRSIKGRLEYKGDELVIATISTKALTDFCNGSNIDASWLVAELQRLKVTDGYSKSRRLASGTNFPNPSVRSMVFDLIEQITPEQE